MTDGQLFSEWIRDNRFTINDVADKIGKGESTIFQFKNTKRFYKKTINLLKQKLGFDIDAYRESYLRNNSIVSEPASTYERRGGSDLVLAGRVESLEKIVIQLMAKNTDLENELKSLKNKIVQATE